MYMENLKVLLGKRIREFRKAKNYTQEELAEKIGIGTNNISYFETGRYTPTLETMEKLANALNVEIYEFYIFTPQKSYEDIKLELIKEINLNEKSTRKLYNYYKNFIK